MQVVNDDNLVTFVVKVQHIEWDNIEWDSIEWDSIQMYIFGHKWCGMQIHVFILGLSVQTRLYKMISFLWWLKAPPPLSFDLYTVMFYFVNYKKNLKK